MLNHSSRCWKQDRAVLLPLSSRNRCVRGSLPMKFLCRCSVCWGQEKSSHSGCLKIPPFDTSEHCVKRESRLSVCELRGNAKLLRERNFCLKKEAFKTQSLSTLLLPLLLKKQISKWEVLTDRMSPWLRYLHNMNIPHAWIEKNLTKNQMFINVKKGCLY